MGKKGNHWVKGWDYTKGDQNHPYKTVNYFLCCCCKMPFDNGPHRRFWIVCCSLLRSSRCNIQNLRFTKDCNAVLRTAGKDCCQKGFYSNTRPHVAAATREILHSFGWEVFYRPDDLLASDYHLFTKLRSFLGGVRLESDVEMKSTGF